MDCIFCKIAAGEIPSNVVYQDEYVCAFEDTAKQAPVHILIVPKKHIESILELNDTEIMAAVTKAIQIIAKEQGVDASGFRVVVNTGHDGGQSVQHLHFHVLGGRQLLWPPG